MKHFFSPQILEERKKKKEDFSEIFTTSTNALYTVFERNYYIWCNYYSNNYAPFHAISLYISNAAQWLWISNVHTQNITIL